MPPHKLKTEKSREVEHYHITQEGHIEASSDPLLPPSTLMWELPRWPRLDSKEKKDEIKEGQKRQKREDSKRKDLQNLEQVGNPTYEYNCHGKTFDNKRCWINDDQVRIILEDNGYKKVEGKAQVGDIVVYKINELITHTGIVHKVDDEGKVVKVQSKWGLGGDWIHDPDDVPGYGKWTVYRKS